MRSSPVPRSLDLFAGIGGITHGLRGIFSPVGYCEIDEFCVGALKRLMREGKIPEAAVHPDVRTLSLPPGTVDAVVGGSPCVGFSSAGKRRGLRDEQSALYADMMRIVRDLRPTHVFMENVAAIVQSDALETVLRDLGGMGYACKWTTLYARDVGAPQMRRRWFLLASTGAPPLAPPIDPHDWTREPCVRMEPLGKTSRKQFKALGNAAVPDQVRAAYAWLASTWHDTGEETTLGTVMRERSDGFCKDGTFYEVTKFATTVPKNPADIVLIPGVVASPKIPKNTLPELERSVGISAWGTPRSSFVNANWVLTARGAKDLPTQLRFDHRTPDDVRHMHPNARWIAWLQGFPPDWLQKG